MKKKKILLIITAVIFALILIMYFTLHFLEKASGSNKVDEETFETYDDFESADYDYNIFEDSEYSEIISNEFIKFCDEYSNLTLGVNDVQDAYSYGYEVGFLTEYIYAIMEGNSDKYNKFFSNKYYQTHKPQSEFTMQKVYDVVITRRIPEQNSNSSDDFETYYCALQYRILDNNGTFRQDIKDGYKTQYIIITNREGRLLIDEIN